MNELELENPSLPHDQHLSIYKRTLQDIKLEDLRKPGRPLFLPRKKDAIQPRIRITTLAIGTLPDIILLYDKGAILSSLDARSEESFELTDVFGRDWKPQ